MFEQAVLPIQNEQDFTEVRAALEAVFAPGKVENFLRGVQRAGLRVRQYEAVLAHGLLGSDLAARYGALGDADRGQIREMYLRMVEQVPSALRTKYFRIYAYY